MGYVLYSRTALQPWHTHKQNIIIKIKLNGYWLAVNKKKSDVKVV